MSDTSHHPPVADNVCSVHRSHGSAKPLELDSHHVWPLAMGGPDVVANRVWLCPNGHRNVHHLLRLLVEGKPLIKYHVKERAVAQSGYDQWVAAGKPTHSGAE